MRADRFSPFSPPSPPDREKRKKRRKSFSPFPPTIFFSVLELYARHPSITAPPFSPQAEGKRLKIVIAAFHACLLLSGRTLDRLARNPFSSVGKQLWNVQKDGENHFLVKVRELLFIALRESVAAASKCYCTKVWGKRGHFFFPLAVIYTGYAAVPDPPSQRKARPDPLLALP